MSKAVIAMVNGMSDKQGSDYLKDLVQSQTKEEMNETEKTLAQTPKCVKRLCEHMLQAVKKNGIDATK